MDVAHLWKFRSRCRRDEHVAGAAADGSAERHGTRQPKLVCCAVHEAELPLLVPSSFSGFHYVLEKRLIVFIALECVRKPLRISGWALGSGCVPRCERSQHRGTRAW